MVDQIVSGRLYTFSIGINQVETTEKFRKLTKEVRQCYLPEESQDLKIFRNFSKGSCEYECAQSRAAETCLCIPWNYPKAKNDKSPYCDSVGNFCFNTIMTNSSNYDNCSCHNDCKSTTYSIYSTSSSANAVNNFCKIYSLDDGLLTYLRSKFLLDNFIKGDPMPKLNPAEFCENFVKKYVTVVEIEMSSNFVTRSLRNERVSFQDQLAALGKFKCF